MAILTDIANELDRYPVDQTVIEIVNVEKKGDPADTDVNEREIWQFHVRLTNNGHLDMSNVSVHVLGLNGAKVRELPTDDFEDGMVVADLNPEGGGGVATSRVFEFKAPDGEKPAGTALLHAHIQTWGADAGFAHFFSNHTKDVDQAAELGIVYPRTFHEAQVFPR
jgi:hypothetical protein